MHSTKGLQLDKGMCTHCGGKGYHPRPLATTHPKPAITIVKVKCAVCWGTGRKP